MASSLAFTCLFGLALGSYQPLGGAKGVTFQSARLEAFEVSRRPLALAASASSGLRFWTCPLARRQAMSLRSGRGENMAKP